MSSGKNMPPFSHSDYQEEVEKMVKSITLTAMAAGNDEDFKTAFSTMDLALWLAQSLELHCLEAVLLNNMGLLHTLNGSWDKALVSFDRSMTLAVEACPSHDKFLGILKKNISCLFDPKIAPPKELNISPPGTD